MSDPFVVQLADLCKAHVTRAKWVCVRSQRMAGRFPHQSIELAVFKSRVAAVGEESFGDGRLEAEL